MKKTLHKKKYTDSSFLRKCRPCTNVQCAFATNSNGLLNNENHPNIPPPLRKAFHFIQENHSNPQLRIKDVAQDIGLSVRRLQQFFRDNLHCHFRECCRCLRAGHAHRLKQENPNLSNEQIRTQVGFLSNHAFYHAKKEYEQRFPH